MGAVLYNYFSLKKFLELYAVFPLILIALAGTYKFGYFFTFDALWVLPSISAYSLFYSILVTTLLFALGSILSLIYLTISDWIGHLYPSIFCLILIAIILSFSGIETAINVSMKLSPLYFGLLYYVYVHSSIFGGLLERSFSAPIVLLLTVCAFVSIFLSGVNDAKNAVEKGTLPIVFFEEQTSYPNDQTDWRLLESIGTSLVLINFKSKWNGSYEIKIVENTNVKSIY